jgi:two-component system chemotaxis sensor kinase CheA
VTAGTMTDFRALFAQEAEGRLTRLGQLVLELEQDPRDTSLVDAIFREVHTLKGAAALVGLGAVAEHAHGLEEVLDELRSQRRAVDQVLIDGLLGGVDRLNVLTGGAGEEEVVDATPQATNGSPPVVPGREATRTIAVPVDRIDELVRLVGEAAAAHLRVGRMLGDRLGTEPTTIGEFNDLSRLLNDLQDRAMRARMVPVATITDQLQRAVRDAARATGKEVQWEVWGGDTELDRGVLHQLSDSLLHLVRNAVAHGIETPDERVAAGKPRAGIVRLHAMQLGSEVIIVVTDDGRGIDVAALRARAGRLGLDADDLADDEAQQLIFHSGLSTAATVSDVAGRGVGLDVVQTRVHAARGHVEVRSEPGTGTEFRVIVPVTLAVLSCLLVSAAGQAFALPMYRVVVIQAGDEPTGHSEGRPVTWADGRPVNVSSLAATLGVELDGSSDDHGPIVVLTGTTHRHAFRVDALLGQREVVVKGLDRPLPRLDLVAGASVDPHGSVLVVLDPPGLIEQARRQTRRVVDPAARPGPAATSRRTILVVDDALTVRELQRSILERAGYGVLVAGDGAEALAILAGQRCDLVLTDVEMPTMDGFALTEAIRARPAIANVPVLILTSRADDSDRQRGLDAGADGYILKSAFDERALLAAVERLLGTPA